jgi:diadenosine tetraphosphate (Ap4A) HIT family hydrolase
MANSTLVKFGLPATLIADYKHWCVLLRPAQVTLGSLVLAAKGEERAFSALPPGAFAELGPVVNAVESGLKAFKPYDKINYLMLMMVDPHVHFHVIPRYARVQNFGGVDFADSGWPGAPDLGRAVAPSADSAIVLRDAIRAQWPKD